jgi:hypothetical protein
MIHREHSLAMDFRCGHCRRRCPKKPVGAFRGAARCSCFHQICSTRAHFAVQTLHRERIAIRFAEILILHHCRNLRDRRRGLSPVLSGSRPLRCLRRTGTPVAHLLCRYPSAKRTVKNEPLRLEAHIRVKLLRVKLLRPASVDAARPGTPRPSPSRTSRAGTAPWEAQENSPRDAYRRPECAIAPEIPITAQRVAAPSAAESLGSSATTAGEGRSAPRGASTGSECAERPIISGSAGCELLRPFSNQRLA